MDFRKYIVMIDYGLEGWKVHAQTDDWKNAIVHWKTAMSLGNQDVQIFKNVEMNILENDAGPEPEKTALEKIDEADKEARDEKYR